MESMVFAPLIIEKVSFYREIQGKSRNYFLESTYEPWVPRETSLGFIILIDISSLPYPLLGFNDLNMFYIVFSEMTKPHKKDKIRLDMRCIDTSCIVH